MFEDSNHAVAPSQTAPSTRSRWAWATCLLVSVLSAGCGQEGELGDQSSGEVSLRAEALVISDVDSNLAYAAQQALKTENRLANNAHPRNTPTNFQGGQWLAGDKTNWRCGFFNGTEWLL